MPRPRTKIELISQSEKRYTALLNLIEGLPDEVQQQTFPAQYLNRNISDILCHLYHWHLMFLDWYKTGMSGEKPAMPAPGYSWKMTPELNKFIQNKYAGIPLVDAVSLLSDSHDKVMKIIHQHSDKELFEKKRYPWTGSTSLGQYLVSATSSHYAWAIKLIKKALNLSSPRRSPQSFRKEN